ncbi:MAG TPA: L-2-hydroxyglutarate oxidase [Gemmatimonadaceae bacterium]|jgi:L-2-hydroxyglutarate oxidase
MQRQVVIVGGGIVGLATAYKLLLGKRHNDVVVLEKERDVGLHQSTHNSGVLHAGLHYAPGSLKARLAREGIREMVAFCREHGIAHEQCGKLMVATDTAERDRLRVLLERGTANGLRGLRWVEGGELRELEPHVGGAWGVHVPEEGIVDYGAVCAALRREVERLGGEVVVNAGVRRLRREPGDAGAWVIECEGRTERAKALINCAGLHADRVARMAGERPDVRIVPFRGEYWTLRPEKATLVRNLIYPVPDPAFPFLGVHFTRMVHGGVEAGPNAVLALAREGYRWRNVNARDLASAISFSGLWRFLARYPGTAVYEVARSLSRRLFVRSLQKLVPQVTGDDLVRGNSGVRAQVMTPRGELVHDFVLVQRPDAVHVLSAPSPAATASLAIGSAVAGMLA